MTGKLPHSFSMHLSLYQAATSLAARTIRRGKLGASLAGRSGAARRWTEWAAQHRRPGPLVWLHAASVGETLAAASIVSRLEAAGVQVVHTYSSSSVARWPRLGSTVADYAPLDVRSHAGATLDALAPQALVFSRGDLWPVLVREAAARSIPVVVVGGTVRRTSRRLRWPARTLLHALHRSITVGAVDAADGLGWEALGVPRDAIVVTGDPRHDAILECSVNLDQVRDVLRWRGASGSVIVAGSIEPEDERPLLEAARALSDVRWMLVPHEPEPATVRRWVGSVSAAGLRGAPWESGPIDPGTQAVVVTRRGLLADLYLAGDAAYVGGGFGPRGVHNLAEPASLGLPVAFGGIGEPLVDAYRRWFDNGGAAGRSAGLAARAMLEEGAALRSVELLRRVAALP